MADELRFRAMGSDAHVIVVGDRPDLLEAARVRIDALERRWSRFIETSEVNELTRRAGSFVTVSADTLVLVSRAVEAWRLSAGAFDPTVLGDLIRAGYDRTFEAIGPSPSGGVSPLGTGAADIEIDGDRIRLPAGTGFDPGGIGKGLAADIVCGELLRTGAAGVCVNLGGDARVAGAGPDGGGWTVAIDHPESPVPIAMIGLVDGAVATSTILKRRWTTGHHLIDPHTGRPSSTDLGLASVVATHGWVAEVLAKAILLAGASHPFDIVGGTGAEALAVGLDGAVQYTPGLLSYTGGVGPAVQVGEDSRSTPRIF